MIDYKSLKFKKNKICHKQMKLLDFLLLMRKFVPLNL